MDDSIKRFLKIYISYIDKVSKIEFDSPIINTFQQLSTGRVLGQEPRAAVDNSYGVLNSSDRGIASEPALFFLNIADSPSLILLLNGW